MNRKTNVKKVFALIGYTSSGKDTILKEVLKRNDKLQPIISTTTRPMREGEVDGVDYHFVSDKDFFLKGTDFVEQRTYHTKVEDDNGNITDATWKYGIDRSELEKGDYLIVIVDPDGYTSLRNYLGNNKVVPIYIKVPEEQLKTRALKRGDLEDEVTRRLEDDKKKFLPFLVKVVFDSIDNSDGKFEDAVKHVESIINKHIDMVENIVSKSKRKGK